MNDVDNGKWYGFARKIQTKKILCNYKESIQTESSHKIIRNVGHIDPVEDPDNGHLRYLQFTYVHHVEKTKQNLSQTIASSDKDISIYTFPGQMITVAMVKGENMCT